MKDWLESVGKVIAIYISRRGLNWKRWISSIGTLRPC
jgi:hypothetical protein